MIDLAMNQNGERIPLHPEMTECKVMRQFHGKPGGLSNVAGPNGLQLYIPRGTSVEEFRQYVGHVPARYRLVQVDKDRRAIHGAEAFQLEILDASGAGRVEAGEPSERDYVRELVRANADMVKTVAERFASMMDAAATLIRAADGAGLPAREPAATTIATSPPVSIVEEVETASPQIGLAHVLQDTLAKATPLLNHLVLTKVVGLTHEQAVQLLGSTAAPKPANDARPPGVPYTAPAAPQPVATAPVDFVAHLNAIEHGLGPDEAVSARALVLAMSPDEIAVWRNRIGALSVPDAVTAVRAQLAQRKAGGAS